MVSREQSAVYSMEDEEDYDPNEYQRVDNHNQRHHHYHGEQKTIQPETETRARHTGGPQIHTTTPRSRSSEPGVHLVEITQCCSLTRFIPCLRKVKIWCVQVSIDLVETIHWQRPVRGRWQIWCVKGILSMEKYCFFANCKVWQKVKL